MHTAATAGSPSRVQAHEQGALPGVAGATVGALGAVDLLIGIAMLAGASAADPASQGPAAAMRAYGVRAVFAGAVNLGFVWAIFSDTGARALWLFVPLGIAVLDIVADFAALGGGSISRQVMAGTSAVHWLFAAAVTAVAVSAWQRERADIPLVRGGA
jgi:hypothetical protein